MRTVAGLLKYPALLLAIVMLSACGYQLRGSAALPEVMAVTYVKGLRPYSTLVNEFSHALRTRSVKVATDPAAATAILSITGNSTEKLVLSVDTFGNVLEYEIRQTIRFAVSDPGSKLLLDEQMGKQFLLL